MPQNSRILIVEDESIVAEDIKTSLQNMGYSVAAHVSSGEDAIRKAGELGPDLILMDIVLRGKINGIEAAQQIHSRFNIPIIFLTAYADENIIEQAKITEPFGYITKPFENRELHSNIEMALFKHEIECKLKENRQWLYTILGSIIDAVVATDRDGKVVFMNPVAEKISGVKQEEAAGRDFQQIFNIFSDRGDKEAENENPVTVMLRYGVAAELANPSLITHDGTKFPIDISVAPINDENGNTNGVVLVIRDITERKKMEEELKEKIEDLGKFYEMSVGRELKMKELKDEIEKLKSKLRHKTEEGSLTPDS